MSLARTRARRSAAALVLGASKVVGRGRAVRAARFANNILRFDEGSIANNGEGGIQRAALTRPGPVVFDVGSNIGQWSTSLLAQPGHRPTLHLFEPSSYTHAKAVDALAGNAEVHQVALSSERGHAELQIIKDGDSMNTLVPLQYNKVASRTETVELDTVDHFCEARGISEITLLKIDAEGHDLGVIEGARGMLERSAIGVIQFEYNWRWVDSRTYLRDVFRLVGSLSGYALGKVAPKGVEFYDQGWHPELESFRAGNYVLVRSDWRNSFREFPWWGSR